MKKKLIDFLPFQIQEIDEFKSIMSSEDEELSTIEKNQLRILYENFIDSATEFGIKHLEGLYKIRSSPNESLEMRKLRLKNRKMDKMPTTVRALDQKLKILFGEDNYRTNVERNNYIYNVEINTFDWNAFNEIIDHFRCIIPCNIILKSLLINKINTNIYFAASTLSGEEIIVYPWSPKSIESKGTVNVSMSQSSGIENITLYPRKEVN